MASWFEITFTGEPTDTDRERVAELVLEGYTSGQLISDTEEETVLWATPLQITTRCGRS